MPKPAELERGTVIGERYRVERVLGSGGMGRVYLSSDAKLPGKRWAVKETLAATEDYERIGNEARMLTRLRHPSLPQVVDFLSPDASGRVFLVMEYIEGMNLGEYAARCGGRPDLAFVLELTLRICDVLDYLHGQSPPIVFRDLKPGNVMIGADGAVRLIDFGIARRTGPGRLDDTVKLGTIGFAAPEQYEGRSEPSSDQYALGALLLHLCTGGQFSAWTPEAQRALRSDLPPPPAAAIRKMLSYRAEDRYASMAEIKRLVRPAGESAEAGAGGIGTSTVAVLGLFRGCGATHTAIAAAHTLAREGGRTAIVELDRRAGSFARIALAWEGEPLKNLPTFSVQGVDYWPDAGRERLADVFGRGYRYVVLDLGLCADAGDFEEFQRADVPVVVGSGREWRSGEWVAFVRRESVRVRPKWRYALPFAASEDIRELRGRLGSKHVYALPLLPDPFGGQCRAAFEPILGTLYAKRERRSRLKLGFR